MRRLVHPAGAAPPIGPYSPAILADGPMLYLAGQGPIDPETGEFRLGTMEEQARLTFDNITRLLQATGTDWEHVVRVGLFLSDLRLFNAMNDIYREYVREPLPVRTTVQVGLPPGVLIEADCIAGVHTPPG
jgi:2-iminobutanoate/2-iminopropanoate deaminase